MNLTLPDVCLTADIDVVAKLNGINGEGSFDGKFTPSPSVDDCGGTIDLNLTLPDVCTVASIGVTTKVNGMACPNQQPEFNATVIPKKSAPGDCGTDIDLTLTLPDVCSTVEIDVNATVSGPSSNWSFSDSSFTPNSGGGCDCGGTINLALDVPFVCESFEVDSTGLSITGPGNPEITFSSSVGVSDNACKLNVSGNVCIPNITTSSSVSISSPLSGSLDLKVSQVAGCDIVITLSGDISLATTQC